MVEASGAKVKDLHTDSRQLPSGVVTISWSVWQIRGFFQRAILREQTRLLEVLQCCFSAIWSQRLTDPQHADRGSAPFHQSSFVLVFQTSSGPGQLHQTRTPSTRPQNLSCSYTGWRTSQHSSAPASSSSLGKEKILEFPGAMMSSHYCWRSSIHPSDL